MALILARCSCDKPRSFPCRSNLWSEWPTKSCMALPCSGCPPLIIIWLGSSARTSPGMQTTHVSKTPIARMTENRELIACVILDIWPSLVGMSREHSRLFSLACLYSGYDTPESEKLHFTVKERSSRELAGQEG